MLLTAQMLATAGLPGYENILHLQRRMRCCESDEKGRVVMSVKWSDEARKAAGAEARRWHPDTAPPFGVAEESA